MMPELSAESQNPFSCTCTFFMPRGEFTGGRSPALCPGSPGRAGGPRRQDLECGREPGKAPLCLPPPSLQTKCLSQAGGGSGCSSILRASVFRSDFRFLRDADHPWL